MLFITNDPTSGPKPFEVNHKYASYINITVEGRMKHSLSLYYGLKDSEACSNLIDDFEFLKQVESFEVLELIKVNHKDTAYVLGLFGVKCTDSKTTTSIIKRFSNDVHIELVSVYRKDAGVDRNLLNDLMVAGYVDDMVGKYNLMLSLSFPQLRNTLGIFTCVDWTRHHTLMCAEVQSLGLNPMEVFNKRYVNEILVDL